LVFCTSVALRPCPVSTISSKGSAGGSLRFFLEAASRLLEGDVADRVALIAAFRPTVLEARLLKARPWGGKRGIGVNVELKKRGKRVVWG
jgi:hypothetical protein